jgi:hypothetical protein
MDGIGTLVVDWSANCVYTGGGAAIQSRMFPAKDLSAPGSSVTYEITGVASGTWKLWAWLDDNGDGNPFPSGNDPASDFLIGCETAVLTSTAGATVDFDLNTRAP